MSWNEPPTFTRLPVEIHTYLSQYLPVIDCQILGQSCSNLRPVYLNSSWRCILIVDDVQAPCDSRNPSSPTNNQPLNLSPESQKSNSRDRKSHEVIESPYWARPVPLSAFLSPSKYSWFKNEHVQHILNGEKSLAREKIIAICGLTSEIEERRGYRLRTSLKKDIKGMDFTGMGVAKATDFSWIPRNYPAVTNLKYEHYPFCKESSVAAPPSSWTWISPRTSTLTSPAQGESSASSLNTTSNPDSLRTATSEDAPIRWINSSKKEPRSKTAQECESEVVSVIFKQSEGQSVEHPYIDVTCYPQHFFTMFESLQSPGLIRSLTLSWETGIRLIDFVLPHFPNLECFIFKPPELFPIQLYKNVLYEIGKLKRLQTIESHHYITRLSNNTVSGLLYLQEDLKSCQVILSCRKLRYTQATVSNLIIPQVTHLTVNDLKDVNILHSIAFFPNIDALNITRNSVPPTGGLELDQSITDSIRNLCIYTKTSWDTLNFSLALGLFKNLKVLTFIPTMLNYEFYSLASCNLMEVLEVLHFYNGAEEAGVKLDDSVSSISEKLKRVNIDNYEIPRNMFIKYPKKEIPMNFLLNMIADPLNNLNTNECPRIVNFHSLWELLFKCILRDLPQLEYLSVSEYYVVKKILNFKWLLEHHKKLKQIMFASEKLGYKGSTPELFGKDLVPFVRRFEDRSHVLDMEAMRGSNHVYFKETDSSPLPLSLVDLQQHEDLDTTMPDSLEQAEKEEEGATGMEQTPCDESEVTSPEEVLLTCEQMMDTHLDCNFRNYTTQGGYNALGVDYSSQHLADTAVNHLYDSDFNGWIV